MTDAPEKIWVQHRTCTVDASGAARLLAMDREFAGGTQYIRPDQHLALVAAAYEAGACEVKKWVEKVAPNTPLPDAIRALTPEDAVAELEKVKSEERERTIQSCTHYCTDCGNVVPVDVDGRGACGHGRVYDVRPEALERVKREARNEAIAATLAALQRHTTDEWVQNLRVPHVKRMIALMEDTDDAD